MSVSKRESPLSNDFFPEAHGGTQNVVSKDFKSRNQTTRPMPKERTISAEAGMSYSSLCKDWGHIQAKCPKRKGLAHKAAVAIQSKGACASCTQVEPGSRLPTLEDFRIPLAQAAQNRRERNEFQKLKVP
ncbi:hypothetical protein CHS0354_014811 [Potamilus streckersoni]|uniref:Uncharacterized protein n=1 Tax=Potamilus streckersoni TaxID=2493646 RepID=A0AAE0RVK0_9BIVA|nr:hypothetical protein CHS0354_014811 [Potamilus streckersoni]